MFPSLQNRLLALALLLSAGFCGCSRTFWRDQADRDSYLAITEKLNDPRWVLPRIDVTPNPASRFYDPYDPDEEPLPPDDSAAAVYMRWVDGWQGYKGWHKFGDVMTVENPQWLANFGISTDNVDPLTGELMGPLPELKNVTLPQAVELAQINNRDYQFEIENMYLAALAVTFQRFQFGVRYLNAAGIEPVAASTATFVPHGPGDTVVAGAAGGVSQLLPAGTQWAVEFANNTIWLFGGGNQTQSMSNLSFSLVQPLLFGAGRKVGLEGLTQSERGLLYQARVLARLRQQIFTSVVGGGTGFLQLLYEVQQIRNLKGNIGRLEEQIEKLLSQSARNKRFASEDLQEWPANTPLPADLPPPLAGKLRFDQALKRIRWISELEVTEAEVQALRNLSPDPGFQHSVNRLIDTLQTDVATLDVLNLQSSLATNTNQLRTLERTLQDDLDSFKILLGLRTDMVFSIEDSLLKQFELIDPGLSDLEEAAKDLVDHWADLDDESPDFEALKRAYVVLLSLVDKTRRNGMDVVIEDMRRARLELPRRLREISEEDGIVLRSDLERAEILLGGAREELQDLREDILETARGLGVREEDPLISMAAYRELYKFRERLVRLTQNLTVIQISMRVELIEVQPFELALQRAVEIAIDNRVDLMNERARVMDARRKVEIAANALLSSVNIVAEADVGTSNSNNPFDFRGDQSRLRAGFSFTAPLDQIDERNAYRISLINYQRQRREYMLAEDVVKQQVRNAWRQLFVLRQNLETSRRAVRIAALQYDSAVEQSNAPPDSRTVAGAAGGASRSSGNGLAGNNLISALNNILNAQNNLVSTYMNYERNRLNIYRDMGIMEIGENGLWVDPFYLNQENGQADESPEEPLGPSIDVDPLVPPAAGAGRSRLGRGSAEPGLVAIPDNLNSRPRGAKAPHAGNGQIRTVSGQHEHAGVSR
ncbi:TolC family protein [Planctomicrobium sp. SH661]|uniref:TolC family protein n=1 Tax=Planctomicrobium sp. SH661 TaxID=3448124 RepID=UPI003F5B281D